MSVDRFGWLCLGMSCSCIRCWAMPLFGRAEALKDARAFFLLSMVYLCSLRSLERGWVDMLLCCIGGLSERG